MGGSGERGFTPLRFFPLPPDQDVARADAFLAQLHTSDGGLIANVVGFGARGLAALRETSRHP
jgi:hypothetical protein